MNRKVFLNEMQKNHHITMETFTLNPSLFISLFDHDASSSCNLSVHIILYDLQTLKNYRN